MTNPPPMTDDLVRRLHGPVQWGYMCLTDGGFIADDTPIEAAARIEALEAALRRIAEGNLGDLPWEANYERIRQVTRAALAPEAPYAD